MDVSPSGSTASATAKEKTEPVAVELCGSAVAVEPQNRWPSLNTSKPMRTYFVALLVVISHFITILCIL